MARINRIYGEDKKSLVAMLQGAVYLKNYKDSTGVSQKTLQGLPRGNEVV
jgi:hypothetical protein